eukprot:355664-Chlamydomonas_euryale.AAC.11
MGRLIPTPSPAPSPDKAPLLGRLPEAQLASCHLRFIRDQIRRFRGPSSPPPSPTCSTFFAFMTADAPPPTSGGTGTRPPLFRSIARRPPSRSIGTSPRGGPLGRPQGGPRSTLAARTPPAGPREGSQPLLRSGERTVTGVLPRGPPGAPGSGPPVGGPPRGPTATPPPGRPAAASSSAERARRASRLEVAQVCDGGGTGDVTAMVRGCAREEPRGDCCAPRRAPARPHGGRASQQPRGTPRVTAGKRLPRQRAHHVVDGLLRDGKHSSRAAHRPECGRAAGGGLACCVLRGALHTWAATSVEGVWACEEAKAAGMRALAGEGAATSLALFEDAS